MASRLAGWALKATPRGARFASSSAAPVRAFPIFGRSRGVVECNDLYIHHVVTDTSKSPLQQKALAEHARAERAAEAAAKFLDAPCETPILLEGMHALRSTHPHLPRGGGVATAMAADKPFAAP
jgi:hypothetical protein|eukprot:GHVU01101533.1.p2 GENE.GHVU01101533.1~~GHVU01101533.1.p2  ORF type:complete len:138 (+),score=19.80 GHVU01101533.1:43-414(+)